jgi:heme/copper-type cytochrome/quinol oxidase subunit 4
MGEGQSNWMPEPTCKVYILLLCIIDLLLHLLLCFVLFITVNAGNLVPALYLWPSRIMILLHVYFSFWWFQPEMIEHN